MANGQTEGCLLLFPRKSKNKQTIALVHVKDSRSPKYTSSDFPFFSPTITIPNNLRIETVAEEYVCAVGVEPGAINKVEDDLCNLSHALSDNILREVVGMLAGYVT